MIVSKVPEMSHTTEPNRSAVEWDGNRSSEDGTEQPSALPSRRAGRAVVQFFRRLVDGNAGYDRLSHEQAAKIDWLRVTPFIAIHLACIAVIWVGFSWVAVGVAAFLYVTRMFIITAFYHRYFSHRSFKTSRVVQFIAAFMGCAAGQRSPLWWAAHHRHHHNHSDEDPDLHSPRLTGFLWSHTGWFLTRGNLKTDTTMVRDWTRFRELAWLDRFDWIPVVLLATAMYALGVWLEHAAPHLGTTGPQMLVWGFFISTVVLYHATYTINSLAHRFGKRRYDTGDDSRNNLMLAILTLGEGWHNNHHHYPVSARQGFYWWEIDLTYYALKAMQAMGLVWDIRPVPAKVLGRNRIADAAIEQSAQGEQAR